jgi:hypothetical protein
MALKAIDEDTADSILLGTHCFKYAKIKKR